METKKWQRLEVYKAIDSERVYQNNLPPSRTDGSQKTVGDYITMLQYYQSQLVAMWTENPGTGQALHVMRKIAGIAVRCMEEHGAPLRQTDEERYAEWRSGQTEGRP